MSATKTAFDDLRVKFPAKPIHAEVKVVPAELVPMQPKHGLTVLCDGQASLTSPNPLPEPPLLGQSDFNNRKLWAVCQNDVPIATERCAFARELNLLDLKIKHSNLTGGAHAHSAGELIALGRDTLVITGRSGRYGPRSKPEMEAAALAFRRSGYIVWTMGWDVEAGEPAPFSAIEPTWVHA